MSGTRELERGEEDLDVVFVVEASRAALSVNEEVEVAVGRIGIVRFGFVAKASVFKLCEVCEGGRDFAIQIIIAEHETFEGR